MTPKEIEVVRIISDRILSSLKDIDDIDFLTYEEKIIIIDIFLEAIKRNNL